MEENETGDKKIKDRKGGGRGGGGVLRIMQIATERTSQQQQH